MFYGFLADLIVAIHVLYVSVVVFGFLAILLGGPLGWKWVRNRWFRIIHLLMIGYVAFEAIVGLDCPLTIWEYQLRQLAGQEHGEGSFVARLLHSLLFYQFEPWVFNTLYILTALLVLSTFWITPVCWQGKRPEALNRG